MVDVGTLANYAEVFGFFAVLGGFTFAIIQIRQNGQQRREAASLALMSNYMQQPGTMAAIRRVSALPEGWVKQPKYRNDRELLDIIDQMQVLLEVNGMMVFRRAVRLSDVELMAGDMVRAVWPKLRPWAEHLRQDMGRPGPFEWAEWLHDRLTEHRPTASGGAFARHRDWRP